MAQKLIILFIIYFAPFFCHAQSKSVTGCYIKETDRRGYDGDYDACVIRFKSDSLFELSYYHIEGMAYLPNIVKKNLTGKYTYINDSTVFLIYEECFVETRSCNKSAVVNKMPELYKKFKNPSQFIVTKEKVYSPNSSFPILLKTDFMTLLNLDKKLSYAKK